MTQSGFLDRRIIIGNKKYITDDEGFQHWEFVEFARPWAKIRNSTEPVVINDENESVTRERVTFEIYYRDGITKSMLIKFNGNDYQVSSIYNPGFRNEMLILTGERHNSRGEL